MLEEDCKKKKEKKKLNEPEKYKLKMQNSWQQAKH